jgi:hypothetical protein
MTYRLAKRERDSDGKLNFSHFAFATYEECVVRALSDNLDYIMQIEGAKDPLEFKIGDAWHSN